METWGGGDSRWRRKEWKAAGDCARNGDMKGRAGAGAAGGKPQERKGRERGRGWVRGHGRERVRGAGSRDGMGLAQSEG